MSLVLHAFWLPDSYVMAFWLVAPERHEGTTSDLPQYYPRGLSYEALLNHLPPELNLYEETRSVRFPAPTSNPVEKGLPIHFGSRHARPPASHPKGNFRDVEGERVASRAFRLTSTSALASTDQSEPAEARYDELGLGAPRKHPPVAGDSSWQLYRIHTGETIADDAFDYFLPRLSDVAGADGVQYGASLVYWLRLLDFARCLFDYKLFVPGMAKLEEHYYPVWQAVILDGQRQRWDELVAAMPPLAYSLVFPAETSPGCEPKCRSEHPLAIRGTQESAAGAASYIEPIRGIKAPFVINELGNAGSPGHSTETLASNVIASARRQTKTPGDRLRVQPPTLGTAARFSRSHIALTFLDAAVDYLARHRIVLRYPRAFIDKGLPATREKRWIDSLRRGRVVSLGHNDEATQRFASAIASWSSGVRPVHRSASYRLAFRLSPAAGETMPWTLEFLLQSTRLSTICLPASRLWSGDDRASIDAYFPGAIEGLLSQLADAAQMFPPIRVALQRGPPAMLGLTLEEVCDFVFRAAPRLVQGGYFVTLPNWLDEDTCRLGIRLQLSSAPAPEPMHDAPSAWRCHWSLVAGGESLNEPELQRLVNAKTPLVYSGGRWLHIDPEAMRAAERQLAALGDAAIRTPGDLIRCLGDDDRDGGLPVLSIDFGEVYWDRPGAPIGNPVDHEAVAPRGLVGSLRPYQRVGLAWLLAMRRQGFGVCLADDMGLGKTVQVIAFLLAEQEGEGATRPNLIVTPTSIIGNWRKEIQRFAPGLTVAVHHGAERMDAERFLALARQHHIVLTTYSRLVRDAGSFVGVQWGSIILDEAQNIKNSRTKHSRWLRRLVAWNRICLTGTPIENRVSELWAIMEFLNPGYLGTLGAFRRVFANPIEKRRDRRKVKLLRELTRPLILRRMKTDRKVIQDLPEKLEMKVYCNLTEEQAALYQRVVKEMLDQIRISAGLHRRGLIISTLSKLKQIANHPAQYWRDHSGFTSERSGKLQLLEEMLDVLLQEGDKAVIFTQFTTFGAMLSEKLETMFGREILYLHGGTPSLTRDEMVERFQRDGGPSIFVLSLKAGGFGLNLTNAQHVFHVDRWWNPAVEDQATDRIYRIGQRRKVQIHKFVTIGTVEERIDAMLEGKKDLAGNLIVSEDALLTEIDDDGLRDLFALTDDAVVR